MQIVKDIDVDNSVDVFLQRLSAKYAEQQEKLIL